MKEDTFMYWVILTTFVVIFCFCYIRHVFTYFERNHIPCGPTPTFPFGNISATISRTLPLHQELFKLHKRFKRKSREFGGIYLFLKPAVMIVDFERIKKIPNTELENHRFHYIDKDFGLNVEGEEVNVSQQLLNYFIDIARTTIFGLQLEDNNNDEFSKIIEHLLRTDSLAGFKHLLSIVYPYFGGNLDSIEAIVEKIVNHRKKTDIKGNDLIQKLIESNLSIKQIADICYNYLITNLECSLAIVLFSLHELSYNLDIQEEMRAEIVRFEKQHKISTDNLDKLKYLDSVVKETMRKYPPNPFVIKEILNSEYCPKGCLLVFSTYGIHHDSEFYINPELFDPDRFSEENVKFIKSGSYLPFGIGGGKFVPEFANLQSKMVLCKMITKYRFFPCKKSEKSICFDTTTPAIKPKELWFRLEQL